MSLRTLLYAAVVTLLAGMSAVLWVRSQPVFDEEEVREARRELAHSAIDERQARASLGLSVRGEVAAICGRWIRSGHLFRRGTRGEDLADNGRSEFLDRRWTSFLDGRERRRFGWPPFAGPANASATLAECRDALVASQTRERRSIATSEFSGRRSGEYIALGYAETAATLGDEMERARLLVDGIEELATSATESMSAMAAAAALRNVKRLVQGLQLNFVPETTLEDEQLGELRERLRQVVAPDAETMHRLYLNELSRAAAFVPAYRFDLPQRLLDGLTPAQVLGRHSAFSAAKERCGSATFADACWQHTSAPPAPRSAWMRWLLPDGNGELRVWRETVDAERNATDEMVYFLEMRRILHVAAELLRLVEERREGGCSGAFETDEVVASEYREGVLEIVTKPIREDRVGASPVLFFCPAFQPASDDDGGA